MASARRGISAASAPFQRLLDEGTLTGMTDAQLLDRFLNERDESAFAFLVARHGPLVRAVCRGVLRNPGDAEDAFQATFLVLFRKASGLRSAGSLGSWLYRVAYRIAIRANASSSRRRERSIEDNAMAAEAAAPSEDRPLDREHLPIIHAEIDRLPERYRAPIALCYLEGLTYEQAAHQLGWPIGTVGSRIARARELLRSRLARRGVTATTAALSALLAAEATAAPAGWIEAAVRVAFRPDAAVIGAKAAGTVPAAVALGEGLLRRMLMIRLIQMTSFLAVAATLGMLAWVSVDDSREGKPRDAGTPVARPAGPADAGKALADRPGRVILRGRVLTPDGQPAAGASIYAGQPNRGWIVAPMTRTGDDGRFELDPEQWFRENAASEPFGTLRIDWKKAQLMAVAQGYGPAQVAVPNPTDTQVEWRLVPDDVPVLGRVLDTQGRPVAGATIQVAEVFDPPAGDPDALLNAGSFQVDRAIGNPYGIIWWVKGKTDWTRKTLTTGPDGRFRIDGAGRDRLVKLDVSAPGIASSHAWAMTRKAPASARPRAPRSMMPGMAQRIEALHGASFDHVVAPSKPIEGIARVKGTGAPIAGVEVIGSAKEQSGWVSATTDREGRFRLEGLPKAASYQLSIIPKPGEPYLDASLTVSDTDGLKPIPVTFEILKGVVVRLRLIDRATRKAVDGYSAFHIKLPSNPNPGEAAHIACSFPAEGYRMTVPPGPGFFYATAAGDNLPYTRARLAPADRGKGVGGEGDGEAITIILSPCHAYRIVDIPANVETFDVDLELTRGDSRKGRLIGPDGRPVTGATAYNLSANWDVTVLEGADFVAVGLEPGKTRTVSFVHKGRRLAGALLASAGEGKVDVRLAPCGSAAGRLVDPDGQPIADAVIRTMMLDHDGRVLPGMVGNEHFATDRDGRFRIEGIHPELGVALDIFPRARPDRFYQPEPARREVLKRLKSKPGETVDLGELRMSLPSD